MCSLLAGPVLLSLALLAVVPASTWASDRSTLNDATREVERGATSIGEGIEQTAKGIGNTVIAGAKTAGARLEQAGTAAEPSARHAWTRVVQGASDVGRSVSGFSDRLFGR